MLFIIYVNYGSGMHFQTGPEHARVRAGVWAHLYRRIHEHCGGCPHCMKRIDLFPAPLPEGTQPGRFHKII